LEIQQEIQRDALKNPEEEKEITWYDEYLTNITSESLSNLLIVSFKIKNALLSIIVPEELFYIDLHLLS
jgi:hypothetical protein